MAKDQIVVARTPLWMTAVISLITVVLLGLYTYVVFAMGFRAGEKSPDDSLGKLSNAIELGSQLKEMKESSKGAVQSRQARWEADLARAVQEGSAEAGAATFAPALRLPVDAGSAASQAGTPVACVTSGTDQFCSTAFHPTVPADSAPRGLCYAISAQQGARRTPVHGFFCTEDQSLLHPLGRAAAMYARLRFG